MHKKSLSENLRKILRKKNLRKEKPSKWKWREKAATYRSLLKTQMQVSTVTNHLPTQHFHILVMQIPMSICLGYQSSLVTMSLLLRYLLSSWQVHFVV